MHYHQWSSGGRREEGTDLAVGTQTDLEERLDVIRYDLRLGSGEHAQNDDRAATLEPGDVLCRTWS